MAQFNWIALLAGLMFLAWGGYYLKKAISSRDTYKFKDFLDDLLSAALFTAGAKPVLMPLLSCTVGITGIIIAIASLLPR
jgi:hypothetical protein